jgi:hypothetical protein
MRVGMISGAGVENIQLERVVASTNYQASSGAHFDNAYGCWARNVRVRNFDGTGIRFNGSFQCEASQCDIRSPFSNISGKGYGIFTFGSGGNHYIWDNICIGCRHSLITEGGGAGNVYAYNYTQDDFGGEDPPFLHGAHDTHAAISLCTYWEGNCGSKLAFDRTFGSSAKNHTVYRGWYSGAGVDRSFTRGRTAVDIQEHNYGACIVGCILGKAGQAGTVFADNSYNPNSYYDFKLGFQNPGGLTITDAAVAPSTMVHLCWSHAAGALVALNNGGQDNTLPNSFIHAAKPSYFGSLAFPPIGPDGAAVAGCIPAWARYLGNDYSGGGGGGGGGVAVLSGMRRYPKRRF